MCRATVWSQSGIHNFNTCNVMKKSRGAIIRANTVGILERHSDFLSNFGVNKILFIISCNNLSDNHFMVMTEEAEVREITEFTVV